MLYMALMQSGVMAISHNARRGMVKRLSSDCGSAFKRGGFDPVLPKPNVRFSMSPEAGEGVRVA